MRAADVCPSLPEVLYHGTTTAYWESKLTNGLSPKSSSCGGVCLTKDKDDARYWASEMADWDRSYGHSCQPVVIAIPVSRLDRDSLKCDFNSVSLGEHEMASEHWSLSFVPHGTVMYISPIAIFETDIVS